MKKLAFVAGLALVLAAPLNAQVLLSDNFNGEGPAGTSLNFNLFTNWNVTGQVDLVQSGDFGVTCASGAGKCVDMDGTSGPGKITTKSLFSFGVGDKMKIAFDISGSQRSSALDHFELGLQFSSLTSIANLVGGGSLALGPISFPNISSVTVSNDVPGTMPFQNWTVEFTAVTAGSLAYSFATTSADNAAWILDNVVISRTVAVSAVPEPSTYAMMTVGLLALVGVSRRRRVR